MIRKTALTLWFTFMVTLFTLVSCDKNDEESPKFVVKNYPVYVSEVTRDNNKNIYSYERVGDKVRLKQIDFYEDGKKKFHSVLKYDNQNRLIEYSNNISGLNPDDYSDYIFGNVVENDVQISYDSDKITITKIDKDDFVVLTLDSNGFAEKFEDKNDLDSNVSLITRRNNNVVKVDNTYIDNTDDGEPDEFVNNLDYDTKESIDYIRMLLPCLYSQNNPLNMVEEGGKFKITYSYEYNSFNYPTKITETSIEIYEGGKYEETMVTSLKYINADDIK